MKRLLPLFALLCLAPAHADEAADLDALCAAAGGQVKRTDISNVRRTDCAGPQVTWFHIHSTGTQGRTMVNYTATRPGGWRSALDAAAADLAKLCGDQPPNIQLEDGKLRASCGSGK
ncbi:MAG: hypothetical protein KF853_10755 [Rhodocyclaceae bacterium]|nr:hypothetical protein [Rhodocyclaceae bacterium]MBX3677493.1 hypothetical protein [Rhodocyclaceae bacterium]